MGVDACARGWIGIVLDGAGAHALHARTITQLAQAAREQYAIMVMAIDIPIGLPDTGVRQADLLARGAVGPRAASVFPTPVRAALDHDLYAAAVLAQRERTGGRGLSAQAFSLRAKIREVEAWLPAAGVRVAETHPEVCFAALAGAVLAHAKKTWAGAELRRRLLAGAGMDLPADLGAAGRAAAVDDVLDAAAAAWTATRIAAGEARCLPDPPEVFTDGLPSAIWC